MAKRRRDANDAPITLFSFQDIITCVTGIMLLVVLLLILGTLDSRATARRRANPELARLQERVEAARRELAEERDWRSRNKPLVEELLATRSEAVPGKLQEARRQQEPLRRQAATADADAEALRRELQAALDKEKEALDANDANAKRQKALEAAVAALEKQAKENERRSKLVKFSVDRAEKAKALLVECSVDGLAIQALEPGAPIARLGDGSNNHLGTLRQFDHWLDSRASGSDYLALLVKPSAATYVLNLAATLKRRGFQFGMEPLEEAKTGMQEP